MTLPAVCSLGACLYAMQCRRNLSGRYYYSLSYLYGACMHASCFRQCATRLRFFMMCTADLTTARPASSTLCPVLLLHLEPVRLLSTFAVIINMKHDAFRSVQLGSVPLCCGESQRPPLQLHSFPSVFCSAMTACSQIL